LRTFHRLAWRAGERIREDGYNEFNVDYVMRISRDLAAHLAEFATVESEAATQTLNQLTVVDAKRDRSGNPIEDNIGACRTELQPIVSLQSDDTKASKLTNVR
jgi:hypothetical protein